MEATDRRRCRWRGALATFRDLRKGSARDGVLGPGTLLEEGGAEGSTHKRACGDGRFQADVQGSFCAAPLPRLGDRFFEWQQRASGKQPYRITRKDLEPFAFAGLWEFARIGGEEILSAAIIVCDANDLVAPLHDRIPVILEPVHYESWLDPATPAKEAKALLKPCTTELLQVYPVSRIVGSPKNDVPDCIQPVADPERMPPSSG
jgi:hypothetical protein